jgi:hypothetical protein
MNFIVVKDNKIENLIVADSLENAESLLGLQCIEYDITLVNPKIGQSIENNEVVDLEVYPVLGTEEDPALETEESPGLDTEDLEGNEA